MMTCSAFGQSAPQKEVACGLSLIHGYFYYSLMMM